jgi:hypothetical protein
MKDLRRELFPIPRSYRLMQSKDNDEGKRDNGVVYELEEGYLASKETNQCQRTRKRCNANSTFTRISKMGNLAKTNLWLIHLSSKEGLMVLDERLMVRCYRRILTSIVIVLGHLSGKIAAHHKSMNETSEVKG